MNGLTDFLRGELERLFELEAIMRLSSDLLGIDPLQIGATTGKGAFARALVERCAAEGSLQALADAILLSSGDADEGLMDVGGAELDSELAPGAQAGELRIVKKLGEGGLGVVYLAHRQKDEGEPEKMALKVIRRRFSQDRSAVARFKTAMRALQSIKAPSLAPILELGQLPDGRPWVAYEYQSGQTLADRIEHSGGMHFNEAKAVFRDVLEALEKLHEGRLVHGDVKAENVFIIRKATDDGAGPTLRGVLVDACMSRILLPARGNVKTSGVLSLLGTPKAIAPERARGAEHDARSDIYAVGTLMYEVLTGRPLFIGDNAMEIIAQHLWLEPEHPSAYAQRGWISPELDDVVARALAKDPTDRYQSAAEMLQAIEEIGEPFRALAPLDREAFDAARTALLQDPSNERIANSIEQQARHSGAWPHAIEALERAADIALSREAKLSLLYRLARICETEAKDGKRAESAYGQILAIDPADRVALSGMESCKRAGGDAEGLVELLLNKVEKERAIEARASILREIASLYEDKLKNNANAFTAWLQALVEDPRDERAVKEVERLAAAAPERWNEAVETLSAAVQQVHTALYPQPGAEPTLAEAQLQDKLTSAEEARKAREAAEQNLEQKLHVLNELEQKFNEASRRAEELEALSIERAQLAQQAHQEAEDAVEAYEKADQAAQAGAEDAKPREQIDEMSREAEKLVEAAGLADQQAQEASEAAASARQETQAAEAARDEARQASEAAEQAAKEAQEAADTAGAAEQQLLEEIEQVEQGEPAGRSARDLGDLVKMYVLLGRWYAERLSRPDVALPCYSQALVFDPINDAAFDATSDLYRGSQSWKELAAVLLQRADRTVNPLKARDFRAEAGVLIARKLNNPDAALEHFNRVLKEDPVHPAAAKATEEILIERGRWAELVELLEKQLETLQQSERVELLGRVAELYEDRVGDLEKAQAKYEEALQINDRDSTALKGLERIYTRKEDYRNLLINLRQQAELAPTPKQRIVLMERMGAIFEEEFVDPEAAAKCFEHIIDIDPAQEAANAALARLYRQLERFDALAETLDRHARGVDDPRRKVELLIQCVKVLMTEVGAPERAIETCERALAVEERDPEALDLLARLKSTAGDLQAALDALEKRAEHERDARKRAELYTRAGQLLEEGRDKDGAVERYKQALDADKRATEAAEALRRIFGERGDAHGVVGVLRKQIEVEEGEIKKAQLLAELGEIYRDQLEDEEEQAVEAFRQALELDVNCTPAAYGLGKIAYEKGKYEEAALHFESVMSRAGDMPSDEACLLYLQAGESFNRIGKSERAIDAFKRARDLVPNDVEINMRLAVLFSEVGDAREAERIYERVHRKFGEEMGDGERVRLLLELGKTQMALKAPQRAVDTLKRGCEIQPNNPELLEALTQAYEELDNWAEVVALLQLRSRIAFDKQESFDLRVRTGDIFLEKLQDRNAATQTYVAALELEPNNRNLLTKLMGVYSSAKDWPRLIDVILRISDMVTDPAQVAKYYRTVATIAHRELGRYEDAANYYEKALANQMELDVTFTGLVECLTQNQDWERLQNVYDTIIKRVHDTVSKLELARLLDARGDILQHRLGRVEEAIRVYEEAQQLDPDNRGRRQMLTEIYAREPKRFFEQSVKANRELLEIDPYHIESYRALRKTYTKVRRPDESWCVCQVLHFLKMADPEEERFFQKYRLTGLVKIKNPMSEELWRELLIHPLQEPALTAIFSMVQPAVIASQAQGLRRFGTDARYKADIASDPRPICRVLNHAARGVQIKLPDVYYCPEDTGGLSFIFTAPPAVGLGMAAAADSPQQALAFVAARHLSYFRPGHFIRQMVPTGTGLRAWMMTAFRMVIPKFPVPAPLEAQVKANQAAIEKYLTGPQRDTLRSLTQKLLGRAPELDMKRWVCGVDLTADRVGLLVCNDLKLANAVIEASPEETASVPAKERERELLRYAISEQYFELRRRLAIALGG